MTSHEVRVLRAITFRIADAASHHELTAIIPSVARHLLDCKSLLSSTSKSKKDSGDSVVVHKFQTQVNTLLNASTTQGRWAATILIKAAIEVGGYETLSNSSAWVRGLLQNLNKSDPTSSKKLIIVTLTRIFLLIHGHQTLVRELTTPSLKDFITICLGLILPKTTASGARKRLQHLLQPTVLDSFAHLIPSHPSLFRPHISNLQEVIVSIVGSNDSHPEHTLAAAERLFALLHYSAPKNKVSSPVEAHASMLSHLLSSLHTTISLVYRSIVEEWNLLPDNDIAKLSVVNDTELNSSAHADPLGFPTWTGIQSGVARLCSLLSLLQTVVCSPKTEQIMIPIARILDVVIRLCSVTIPASPIQSKNKALSHDLGIRINDQISQTERDALFIALPSIHASAIDLLSALCVRLGAACKPLHESMLEQLSWVFRREAFNAKLRASCYLTLSHVLGASASGLPKATAQQYIPMLTACYEDILSSATTSRTASNESINGLNADALAPQKKSGTSATYPHTLEPTTAVVTAANQLLKTALASIPPSHIPSRVRSKLDRTAILTQSRDAMLASVLNPPLATRSGAKTPASILPFLARANPHCLSTEALLRPRMPAIRTTDVEDVSEDDSTHEDMENEPTDEEAEPTAKGFTLQTPFGATPAAQSVDHGLSNDQRVTDSNLAQGTSAQATALQSPVKRAASPTISGNDVASKRQRVTDDTTSQSPQPVSNAPASTATSASTTAQPADLPSTSAGTAEDRETAAVLPTERARLPPIQTPNAGTSAVGTITIEGDDSDDDFTIPEISLEMDTEDEEDEDAPNDLNTGAPPRNTEDADT